VSAQCVVIATDKRIISGCITSISGMKQMLLHSENEQLQKKEKKKRRKQHNKQLFPIE